MRTVRLNRRSRAPFAALALSLLIGAGCSDGELARPVAGSEAPAGEAAPGEPETAIGSSETAGATAPGDPEPLPLAPEAGASASREELGAPPETLEPPALWSEVVQLQSRVHDMIVAPRKSVETMQEIARLVDRMAALIQALPGRLALASEDDQVRVDRLVRSTLISVGHLQNAAQSLIPGQLLEPMHELDRWMVTLEGGLPRDRIGDARVRTPDPVDWNKVR